MFDPQGRPTKWFWITTALFLLMLLFLLLYREPLLENLLLLIWAAFTVFFAGRR